MWPAKTLCTLNRVNLPDAYNVWVKLSNRGLTWGKSVLVSTARSTPWELKIIEKLPATWREKRQRPSAEKEIFDFTIRVPFIC